MIRDLVLGIDIGGTFTDVVLAEPQGSLRLHKLLTTPQDPSKAVFDGATEILDQSGYAFDDVELLVHSTTLVTNALTEQRGARTGLITTSGFRDLLEMRREHRYDIYNLFLEWPAPLVPRSWRIGVDGRVLPNGEVYTPIDDDEVDRAVDRLLDDGAEAIAVSLLHSYANGAHERQIRDRILARRPDMIVSLSHEVAPIIGEYERTSTAVADAYARPLTEKYLRRMEDGLRERGFEGNLFMMLSGGGTASVRTAARRPVRMVESGPAAGALAAGHYSRLSGVDPLISFDMGGTTAKICLLEKHEPSIVNTLEVARTQRFSRGSGFPVVSPSVDLVEIGAGGGSIAWVDELGLLRVGPESASADPGPACYGRGGDRPTVTDANLLLGLLDPDYFLGGDLTLDAEASRRVYERLGAAVGLSAVDAAWGVHQIVNESMAQAARMHLQERNVDPSNLAMIAFGGAGPAHASAIARLLGVSQVLFPLGAGTTSALGCIIAPLSFQYLQSSVATLDTVDWNGVNQLLDGMRDNGYTELANAGADPRNLTVQRSVDVRVYGQQQELSVALPSGTLSAEAESYISQQFSEQYRAIFQHYSSDYILETVNWKVTISGPARNVQIGESTATVAPEMQRRKTRRVYLPEHRAFSEIAIVNRYGLDTGSRIEGPAIVQERETTIVLPVDSEATVDKYGNLVARIGVGRRESMGA